MSAITFLAASVPLFVIYLLTLSPTVPLEDGGEMIRAAFCLGVTHPPGYPLYTLIGRLAMVLKAGDPAFRMNLLSAAMASLGCGLAAVTAVRLLSAPAAERPARRGTDLSSPSSWSVRVPAVLGAWLLGLAPGIWWQAVIAEKYATNLFFNSLLLAVMVWGMAGRRTPAAWLPLAGLAFGLSASHHGQTVYFAPALLVAAWWGLKRLPESARPRTAGFLIFMVLLGLSVKFIHPPVRAAAHPLHNWNDPSSLSRWLGYFSGSTYQYRMFYWKPSDVAIRVWDYLIHHLPAQFGWLGIAVGAWGFWKLVRSRPWLAALTGAAWAAGLFYCVNFSLTGIAIRTYYIPTFLVFSLWIAAGLAGAAVLAAGLLWACFEGVSHRLESDRSRHLFAWDFSRAILRSVESDSLLVAYGDYDLFPLWFMHDVMGVKPGVILINANFLPVDWAKDERARVQLLYPKGADAWAKKLPYVSDLLKADPGRPVYFSVIFEAIEKVDVEPRGAAYRHVRNLAELANADILGEWADFRRWRTLRGIFDSRLKRDTDTRSMLSYYAYADYRRGFVLMGQHRPADAIRLFRSALAWPDFHGEGPAGAHASLGQCLKETGKTGEAIAEFEEAARLRPDWTPPLKMLGNIYLDAQRYPDALRVFRKILEAEPDDALAARNVRMLEAFSGIGKKAE